MNFFYLLKLEGMYSWMCNNETKSQISIFENEFSFNNRTFSTCPRQKTAINQFFQIGSASNNVFSFLIGGIIDIASGRFGGCGCKKKRKRSYVGLVWGILAFIHFVVLGFFGALIKFRFFDQFPFLSSIAYSVCAVCETGIFLTAMKVFMSLPNKLSFFSSVANGLFNAANFFSILIFNFFYWFYYYLDFDIFWMFVVYSSFLVILFLFFSFCIEIPKSSIPKESSFDSKISNSKEDENKKEYKETDHLIKQNFSVNNDEKKEKGNDIINLKKEINGIVVNSNEIIQEKSFFSMIFSLKYIITMIWMAISVLQLDFFISTVYDQIYDINKSESQSVLYSQIYNYIFSILGTILSIIFGLISKSLTLCAILSFFINIIWSSLSLLSISYVQIVAYCFEVASNALVFVVLFESCRSFFGTKYLATLTSIIMCVSGLFALLQLLVNESVHWFGGFFYPNLILMVAGVVVNILFTSLLLVDLFNKKKFCKNSK